MVTTSTVPPPVFENGDLFILDLIQHFEPTPLPYSPNTTHTSNCYNFGTNIATLLFIHYPEPRVQVPPLLPLCDSFVSFTDKTVNDTKESQSGNNGGT